MQIFQLGLRGLQLVFCPIVLALSVIMVHQANDGYHYALIPFAAFCGAWGLIVAAIGIAAAFLDKIPGFIMAAIDGLTTLFFLGAAIAFADKLGVHSCNADKKSIRPTGKDSVGPYVSLYTYTNPIINAGFGWETDFNFVARCQEAQADTAFLFFALVCFIGSIGLDFLSSRSGGGSRSGRSGFKFPNIGKRGANYA